MKIEYRTKEMANKEQEEEFLELSGTERFYRFLALMQRSKSFKTKAEKVDNGNFKVVIKTTI
ncbi:MAG: hypothetical protein ABJN84_18190 [Flavobacteriaceae bacterium]